jgi:DNA-binding SARP family transcriptional activator
VFLPQLMRPLPGESPAPDSLGVARIRDVPCSFVVGPAGSVVAERLAAAVSAWGRWDSCVWLRVPTRRAALLPGLLAAAFAHRWGLDPDGSPEQLLGLAPEGAVVVIEVVGALRSGAGRLLASLRARAADRGVNVVVLAEGRLPSCVPADHVVRALELATPDFDPAVDLTADLLDPGARRKLAQLTRRRPAIRHDALDAALRHPDAVTAAVRGSWRRAVMLDRLTADLVGRCGREERAALEVSLATGYWHPQFAATPLPEGGLRPWLVPLEGQWSWLRPVWRRSLTRVLSAAEAPPLPVLRTGRPVPRPPTSDRPVLEVQMLGGFECRLDGRPVTRWNGPRGLSVLRYLLYRPRHECSRDELLEEFWPGVPEAAARNRLQVAVSGVRRALQAVSPVPVVEYADGGYRIVADVRVEVDIERFAARIAAARSAERAGELDAALGRYAEAIDLYRGEFAADAPYEGWTLLPRETLRIEHLDVLDRCLRLQLAADRMDDVVATAHKMLNVDPCREDAHRVLMRCYARQGRPYQALRQFEFCSRVLRATLDRAPEPRTAALHHEIRVGRAGARTLRH